jgi:hypothetical protein
MENWIPCGIKCGAGIFLKMIGGMAYRRGGGMRFGVWILVSVCTAAAVVCLTPVRSVSQDVPRTPAPTADALAAYDRIASVLQSPRCLNCHPRSDRPAQGDDRHIHRMNVQRGADGNGMPVMRCSACHQEHNNDMAGIPGAPHWHLAPATMGWVGLSKAEPSCVAPCSTAPRTAGAASPIWSRTSRATSWCSGRGSPDRAARRRR